MPPFSSSNYSQGSGTLHSLNVKQTSYVATYLVEKNIKSIENNFSQLKILVKKTYRLNNKKR